MSTLWKRIALVATLAVSANAASVYLFTNGASAPAGFDNSVKSLLEAAGHTVTLGVQSSSFDGTTDLSSFDVLYLQTNYNWSGSGASMPNAGQTQIVNFVNAGGGLVTSEWLLWRMAASGSFAILNPIMPVVPTSSFDGRSNATHNKKTANAEINAGLPDSFVLPMQNISGTFTKPTTLRSGAEAFYVTDDNFIALAGWQVGAGRVAAFASLNGAAQINNANGGRLLQNTIGWAANQSTAPIPEPATISLAAAALAGVALLRKRL